LGHSLDDSVLRTEEVAAILGIPVWTVQRLARQGLLAEYPHALRNLIDRQASIRMIGYHSREGHGWRRRFFRILHKRRPAALRDCPQPTGSVAISAAQDDPHDAPPMGFGGGNEQGIGGGTSMVDFRPLIQSDVSDPQKHMMVGGAT
jgi:hypothetical protein